MREPLERHKPSYVRYNWIDPLAGRDSASWCGQTLALPANSAIFSWMVVHAFTAAQPIN